MNAKPQSLFIFIFAFATSTVFAQIPNSGFENWTAVGSYLEPDAWPTTNFGCSGTFYPITRASDPYPISVGSYSLRLENNTALITSYCGFGFTWNLPLTVSQSAPAFPVTGHPNSLTGYYKWLPQNGDTMYIDAILFKGGAEVATAKFTATNTASNWSSFNIPFSSYTSADSGLIMMASYYAEGPNYLPHGNSILYLDNFNFDTPVTGVPEINESMNISVYPNPFTSATILQTENPSKNATLTVYNSYGQIVRQVNNITGQAITFYRDNLPGGLYFIRLTENNFPGEQEDKIIKIGKLIISN